MPPIADIAARLGLTTDLLEPCGHAIAKIRLEALDQFSKRRGKLGYGKLPVCIAKTQYPFTDDPKQVGATVGWAQKLDVDDQGRAIGMDY